MCKPCVGAKLVLRFQALIAHASLDRSIPISFISRFGAIVSHFVRGDIFFDSPCTTPSNEMQFIIDGDALVHKFSWPKNSIYADICRLYTQYVANTYSDAVVVCDGYYGGASTKVETHRRRAEHYRHTLVNISADKLFLPTHQTKRP